jgi:hypothetical protein
MPIVTRQTVKPVNRKSGHWLRFWSFVNKEGPLILDTKCWVWNGPKRNGGYGRFRVNNKKTEAHRYSYELHKGKIPDGLIVLHACDNPSCVNPEHLNAGTVQDNIKDMIEKKRQAKGITKATAKLTEEQVKHIRRVYKPHCPINGSLPLCRKYNISTRTLWSIIYRETWTHI